MDNKNPVPTPTSNQNLNQSDKNRIISSSFIRTMAKDTAVLEGKPVPKLDKKKPVVPSIKKASPPPELPVVESIRGPGLPSPASAPSKAKPSIPVPPIKKPEAPKIEVKSKTKHLKPVLIGLIVIILIGGIGGFFYWWNYLRTPISHLECQDYQCVIIQGKGTDQCQINEDCQVVHYECQDNQCIIIEGEGEDKCSVNEDCQPVGPEPLIKADETKVIELAVGEEHLLLEKLKALAIEEQPIGSFKRILAELISTEERNYLDLASLSSALNISLPEEILSFVSPAQADSGNYTLFLYSQEEGNRLGIVFDIQEDLEITNQKFKDWEETIIEDLKSFHLKDEIPLPFTEDFQDNIYQDIAVRYINFPMPDLSIDYAIADNKLVITTSRESMHAAIGALLTAKTEAEKDAESVSDDENDEIDISGWQVYRNEEYGFEFKYPEEFQQKADSNISESFSGEDGNFWIFIDDNSKSLDAEGIKKDYYENDEYGYQYQDSFLTIDSIESYKQGRYELGVIENYYIPKDDKIYRIVFEFNFDIPNQILEDTKKILINQILSTFKFAD